MLYCFYNYIQKKLYLYLKKYSFSENSCNILSNIFLYKHFSYFIIIRFFRKTFWNSKYLYFLNLVVCFVKNRAKIKGGREVIGGWKFF